MFKVVSLFAGCGGSSLGYQLAGGKVMAAVEFDPHAASIYQLDFPDTLLLQEDITQLSVEALLEATNLQPGELDILDGSPPCQGFSTAGKRQIQDPRNRLFLDYTRLLSGLQPKAFVMENVPGLVAGKMKHTFFEMVERLVECGYQVQARILNAAHYGVPQARRRVIILGIRADLGIKPSHPTPTTAQPVTVKQALTGLTDPGLYLPPKGRALDIAKALKPGESGADLHHRYRQVEHDFSLARLSWYVPSPTVCKTLRPGQCGLLHPEELRFLGIAELKRLCGFPDSFVLQGSFEAQWARLGNAVPPPLTQAIATHLLTQLKERDHAA